MLKEYKGAYSHFKLGRLTTDNGNYVNEESLKKIGRDFHRFLDTLTADKWFYVN